MLSEDNVRSGSINSISNIEPEAEDRLLSILHDSDARLNRNSIADCIIPALNDAFYSDSLISNVESLEKCFVTTEGRTKFDSQLGMYFSDPKPILVRTAKRIKKNHSGGPLEDMVKEGHADHASPVTLILGGVGVGKTTYLKHFELVSGKKVLGDRGANWINIDFEGMGQGGSPRQFLYKKLLEYITRLQRNQKNLVASAYKQRVEELKSGPLEMLSEDPTEFNRRVTDIIQEEYVGVERYVDQILGYLTQTGLCIVALDNVDLYQDEALETTVFAEGVALSKRIFCNVIMCLRDRTYVNHKNDPTFNAYELRMLWLDPPPFRPVLASRIAYSKKILKAKQADIPLENGMHLHVPNLGLFFDIVQ